MNPLLQKEGLLERWRLRADWAASWPTNAFRVAGGAGDALDGLWVDVLAGHWLVHLRERELPLGWRQAAEAAGAMSLWVKSLSKGDKEPPLCVWGQAEAEVEMFEEDWRLEVQLAAGYNCGVFLDQRENRRRVRATVKPGQRVLNLFSYTCSFSVAAAMAGAVVTSVDLNAGYLDWGRRNVQRNGMDPAAHHWIKGDSFDWLRAFARKGRRFDGVILDPPTFSRGTKKKVFRVEQDYAELVALAAAVLEPGGFLLATANTFRLEAELFRAQVRQGLVAAGAGGAEMSGMLPMPADFAGDSYLKGVWVRLG
jgi:23S rRNA (cytosine1962-C5)-methyltransferase